MQQLPETGVIYNGLRFRSKRRKFMNVWKWLIGIVVSTFLSSSGLCSQPAEPANPDTNLLVSGKLVRVDELYSYKPRVLGGQRLSESRNQARL